MSAPNVAGDGLTNILPISEFNPSPDNTPLDLSPHLPLFVVPAASSLQYPVTSASLLMLHHPDKVRLLIILDHVPILLDIFCFQCRHSHAFSR